MDIVCEVSSELSVVNLAVGSALAAGRMEQAQQQAQQHAQQLFERLRADDAEGVAALLHGEQRPLPPTLLLARDAQQETPLSTALRSTSGSTAALELLLHEGAAASVFVKGYSGVGSMVCTLPMADQAESKSVTWAPRISLDASRLAILDRSLVDHVDKLALVSAEKKALAEADKQREEAAKTLAAPFEHYPPALQVGDIVRRGASFPSQVSGEHDVDVWSPDRVWCAGVVMSVQAASVSVEWCVNWSSFLRIYLAPCLPFLTLPFPFPRTPPAATGDATLACPALRCRAGDACTSTIKLQATWTCL